MLEYLRARSAELSAVEIRERIRAAARELENVVAAVRPVQARMRPFPEKWTIAEVVDHISQTQVRGTEELRHLLAGKCGRNSLRDLVKRDVIGFTIIEIVAEDHLH